VVGGAVGRTWGQCCELQQLWVDDSLRNRGTARRLMQDFEAQATARGCSLVYLETFSFQAPVFYAKVGYASVHEFQGFTHGITKHIMQKKLVIP
jgi:N-acetylglutamate synthase-like GNAT family acetyltransferase